MEVNENYYGLKENWFPLGGSTGSSAWQSNIPDDERFKLANFLNNTQAALQSDIRNGGVLGNAIYKAYKTDSTYYDPTFEATLMGKVFDESIEFAGMSGDYCPYSRIMYFSNRREQDQGSTRELVNEGEELIDVWNYFYTTQIPSITQGYGNLTKRWSDFYVTAPSSPSGTYGYEFTAMRWMPGDPQDSPIQIGTASSSYPYYYTSYATRNQLTFITQFPCRRTVLVPTVSCSDDALNPTNVRTYDLYTYLNDYKETHPIVWSIQFEIYTKSGASDLPTSSDRRALRQTMIMASNTPLSLPFRDGSPYVQTMAAGGTLVNEDNPFIAPQIIPTGSNCTPIGGPINVGLGASMSASGLWELTGGNSYTNFSVWAVINCGALEFNNWTSRIIGGATPCRCYCNAADYTKSEFREAVRHAVACFGMFFTDSSAYAETAQLDDDTMHLGVLVDGIGYGEYTSGDKNTEQPQFGWKTMNESDYDPSIKPEPDIPDDSTEDNKNKTVLPSRGMLMPFTGSYVFDYLPLTGLLNACTHHYIDMQDAIEDWNLHKNEHEDSLDFESYLWRQWGRQANPVDCLQNITYYPFNIRPHMTSLAETQVIQVGSYAWDYRGTDIIGSKVVAATTTGSIWCGNGENSGMRFPITDANDFRSYAPYVSATLYLPFCGSIELDPQVFVGHTIKVNYLVDWRTGVCLALVYRDNLVVEAVSGQMGNKVNLQMLDGTTWASQLANASVQESNAHFNRAASFFATVSGLASIAGGVAVTVGSEGAAAGLGAKMVLGGISGVAGGLMGMKKADLVENKAAYDIGTTPIPTRQISTASPAVNASNEMRVRLVVFKSEEEDSSNYAHTVGHACLKYGTLKNLECSGYTVCQTIDTAGINATEAEKEKIRSLLMGGVYV